MDFLVEVILPFVIAMLGIILIIVAIGAVFNYIGYRNNTAEIVVYLDGRVIYHGMDRYISYSQVGENGNRYEIEQYKVGFWNQFVGKKIKVWYGQDLTILTPEEAKEAGII